MNSAAPPTQPTSPTMDVDEIGAPPAASDTSAFEERTWRDEDDDVVEHNTDPDTTIRDAVAEELRKLLVSVEPNVRNGLEMRFALQLLIKLFHDLADNWMPEKDDWLAEVKNTIIDKEEDSTVRSWTGKVITEALESAIWGFQKQEGSFSYDTVRSLNAIYSGMMRFVRKLQTELEKKQQEGIYLEYFEVEENQTDDEGEKDGDFIPKKAQKQLPQRSRALGPKSGSRKGHVQARPYSIDENIQMVEIWRDNHEKSAADKTDLHNQMWKVCNPNDTRTRTREGLRQQMDKLVGLTVRGLNDRIATKIASLQAKKAASSESGEQ